MSQKFKYSLSYIRPCLKARNRKSQTLQIEKWASDQPEQVVYKRTIMDEHVICRNMYLFIP